MKVVWTDEAKAHLTGIHEFIKHDAPFYATQTVDKLTRRVDQLIDHPRSGRVVPKYGDENLIYRIRPDRIDIVAVFHGAQQLPDSF